MNKVATVVVLLLLIAAATWALVDVARLPVVIYEWHGERVMVGCQLDDGKYYERLSPECQSAVKGRFHEELIGPNEWSRVQQGR